jgi:RNA polymerase sigma factor FliA
MVTSNSSPKKFKPERNALIAEYQVFVETIAKKLIHRMGLPNKQYDDFVAAGYLGLVEAATRYRPRRGASFKTFAYLRIRGAIIDSIRECSDVSGAGYRYARALQAVSDLREDGQLTVVQKPSPESHDTSARLAEVLEYAAKSALAFRLSLADAEQEMAAQVKSPDPESSLIARESAQLFASLIKTLPRKERMVIEQYYFKGKSFKEIVESHKKLSKSWVSRLHGRALTMLKVRYEQAMRKKNC